MTKLHEAIKLLRPNTNFGIGNEDDWNTIQMSDESARPTDKEIQSVWKKANQNSALSVLRDQRNQLLVSTDWRATVDYPGTDNQLWLDYRQSLRDLPANSPNVALDEQSNLINVTWPEVPE